MKKILFATTAAGAIAFGGMASAQGISLFGDARVGLGYNINNDGTANYNDEGGTDDDVRVVSRVRFGVRMTGESPTGLTFGATIRADNASSGQGDTAGQRAGEVFVSGAFGTMTAGDTSGADEQHVGDLPGVGLTNLGDINETIYFTNGGSFVETTDFDLGTATVGKRPTLRYDYDFAGFGVSLSTDRDLADIAVGGSYSFDVNPDFSFDIGAGWADVSSDGFPNVPDDIEQWSVGVGVDFAGIGGKVIYTDVSAGDVGYTQWGLGASYAFNEWGVSAFYWKIDSADGALSPLDGDDSYGVGMTYNLGGGATLAGGVARTFGLVTEGDEPGIILGDRATVADFGIRMSF